MNIEKIYLNPKHPASFSSVESLHRAVKGKISKNDIKKWLQGKESYTLHRSVRKKFIKNKVIVSGMNQQYQADLVDMQALSTSNDGYKYLLTCIDVFSKYAWAVPLTSKRSEAVTLAFKKIFRERIPRKLQTDAGKEFTNKLLQNYLKLKNIIFFSTNNATKACIVERFNRTLKTKMWKYFTENNTKRYIDVLDQLVHSYNHTWHRSIQTEPVSVSKENENEIWNILYRNKSTVRSKPKFKLGDTVRISKDKLIFEKGYEQNWTREIFTVHEILQRNPVVYRLRDLAGEVIQGTFYDQELQKVLNSSYYPVEKVLKTRKRSGRKEYFVKFQGYPEKFNMWVQSVKRI